MLAPQSGSFRTSARRIPGFSRTVIGARLTASRELTRDTSTISAPDPLTCSGNVPAVTAHCRFGCRRASKNTE